MSLYAEYLRERTNDLILETGEGFVTYRYLDDGLSVYLIDIYIDPDFRRTGAGSNLAKIVLDEAKERGCIQFYGSVVPSMKNSTESIKALLGYGMAIHSAASDFIILRKGI